MVGVSLGPWPVIANRTLTAERNRLLLAFGLLLAVNLALGTTFHYRMPWEKWGGYGALVLVAAKFVYTFSIYRASRILRQAGWLTGLYVALAPFAGFEVIPFVALLMGIRLTRGTLEEIPS